MSENRKTQIETFIKFLDKKQKLIPNPTRQIGSLYMEVAHMRS